MRYKVSYFVLVHACVAIVIGLSMAELGDKPAHNIALSLIVIACLLGLIGSFAWIATHSVQVTEEGFVVRGWRGRTIPWESLSGWRVMPEAKLDESAVLLDHNGNAVLTISPHLYDWSDGLRWVRLKLPKLTEPEEDPTWRGRALLWNAGAACVALLLLCAWFFQADWRTCMVLTLAAFCTLVFGLVLANRSRGRIGLVRYSVRPGLRTGLLLLALTLWLQPIGPYVVQSKMVVVPNLLVGFAVALLAAVMLKAVHWFNLTGWLALGLFWLLGSALFANLNTTLCLPEQSALFGEIRYADRRGTLYRSVYSRLSDDTTHGHYFVPAHSAVQERSHVQRHYGQSVFGTKWSRNDPPLPDDFD